MNSLTFIPALLLLILPIQQQPKPETVALVFGPEPARIEIVATSQAEKDFERLSEKAETVALTEEEVKLLAALNYALGTIPTTRVDPVHPAWRQP